MKTGYVYYDAGRREAGRKTTTGDCIVRGVAKLCNLEYDEAMKKCHAAGWRLNGEYVNPKNGKRYKKYTPAQAKKMFAAMGFEWHAWDRQGGTWGRIDDAPDNALLKVRRHVVAKVDSNVHDTWDSRWTEKRVYVDSDEFVAEDALKIGSGEDLDGKYDIFQVPRAVYGWYIHVTN